MQVWVPCHYLGWRKKCLAFLRELRCSYSRLINSSSRKWQLQCRQALQYKPRRLWGLSNRPQTEAVSGLKMNPWKLREMEPRALSHLYKAPESNMSAVMLLWPWVRLGPWCLKTYPASVPSLSGIGRTSPPRIRHQHQRLRVSLPDPSGKRWNLQGLGETRSLQGLQGPWPTHHGDHCHPTMARR